MTTKQPEQSSREAVSRRAVVAAGLAPLVLPRHVLGGRGYQAPSDTLAIAAVGVGGMGRNYLEGCKQEKIVALCDLDHNYAAKAFDTYPAARRYHDYREMFDKEARNFDALDHRRPRPHARHSADGGHRNEQAHLLR